MLIYCIVHPILTMTFFMIWYFQTPLTGERIGMAPVLLGLVLFVTFVVEALLVLILGKRITNMRSKTLSLVVASLLYESILWFFSGNIALIGAFKSSLLVNLELAFSFSSILALLIIRGLMVLKKNIKDPSRSRRAF